MNGGLNELVGYLSAWSSILHFIKANGYNRINKMPGKTRPLQAENEDMAFPFGIVTSWLPSKAINK
ncbi:MAG: hypothetical protein JST47_13730 [Bacteroidetes bacterium]|nr:hypothetical protein [Bacteroidota bacterium]MBS1973055.1 hypothetical protein [Bacteroidota bacterium]